MCPLSITAYGTYAYKVLTNLPINQSFIDLDHNAVLQWVRKTQHLHNRDSLAVGNFGKFTNIESLVR